MRSSCPEKGHTPNMAGAQRRTSVVVITDSRGVGLQEYFNRLNSAEFNIRVLAYKGKGIVDAVQMAKPKIIWWQPKVIFVLNGICDVTELDRATRQISLRHESEALTISLYKDYLTTTYHQIQLCVGEYPLRIVYGPIIGIDLSKYNGMIADGNQQENLNSIINQLNVEINRFNEEQDSITPWIARDVHRNVKGKSRNRYQLLADDGVHLTPDMKQRWVIEIMAATKKNYRQICNNGHLKD